jgi:hypothetical protein
VGESVYGKSELLRELPLDSLASINVGEMR